MVNFQVTGLKELSQALQQMPARIERNIMAGAITAGIRVILAETKIRAPENKIKQALSIRQKKAGRGQIIREIYIKQRKGMDTFYAKFFEFGTASYYTGKGRTVGKPYMIPKKKKSKVLKIGSNFVRKKVMHPGVKPRPFLRPALDIKSAEAVRTVASYIRLRLPMETGQAARGRITRRMIEEALSES